MQMQWPAFTIGRLIALFVLILAVLSLLLTINVQNLLTWLIIGLAVAFLIG